MDSYVVQGKVVSKTNNLPVPGAKVEVFEVDPSAGTYSVDPIITTPSNIFTDSDGKFYGMFNFPGPAKPDIIFRLRQKISGIDHVIYNEIPAFNTRWNIANVVYVNIKVEEYCVTISPEIMP